MAQWVSDNVTEVTVEGSWTNGQPVDNVFCVRREEDSPVQSARDVLSNWQDHIVAALPNNYHCIGARYTDHNEENGATGFILADPGTATQGAVTGAAANPSVCLLVHKRIDAHVGRRGGRTYIPCVDSVLDEDGVVDPTNRTAYSALFATFLDGISGAADNELVIVHRGALTTNPHPVSLVTGMDVDAKAATQRRRLR